MAEREKTEKKPYQPMTNPEIINVLDMPFVMIDGRGSPGNSGEYADAIKILDGIVKEIGNYIECYGASGNYRAPLDILWSTGPDGDFLAEDGTIQKDRAAWTMMVRLPYFIRREIFEDVKAKAVLSVNKEPVSDGIFRLSRFRDDTRNKFSPARLEWFTEGLCAQVMHVGNYGGEAVILLSSFMNDNGLEEDMGGLRRYHEIFFDNPLWTSPERLKTVIRLPVRRRKS